MRIGTRASALALAQAGTVAALLGEDAQLVPVTTSGDRASRGGAAADAPPGARDTPAGERDTPAGARDTPAEAQDKERWVKELEVALLEGEIDLAVHSAKDVPSELPEGLQLAGAPRRGDPFDALVGAASLARLPAGARVGTSSLRRAAQLRAVREDLLVVAIHGNVDSRLRRLAAGELDALVLAAAGLIRLDRGAEIGAMLGEFVPAAGQGTLALEARAGDERAHAGARAITDPATWDALCAERALVAALGASCNTPLGAHATIAADGVVLRTFVGLPDGSAWLHDETPAAASALQAGALAAQRLLSTGAAELLRRAEELAA